MSTIDYEELIRQADNYISKMEFSLSLLDFGTAKRQGAAAVSILRDAAAMLSGPAVAVPEAVPFLPPTDGDDP